MHQYFQYLTIALLLGMLLFQVLAYQFGKWRSKATFGMAGSTVETAIFALLGLIIAFTFAGTKARFESRRQLIVDEVNAIHTTLLRLDLLPDEYRGGVNALYSDYLRNRIEYSSITTSERAKENMAASLIIQAKLWDLIVDDTRNESNTTIRMLILPALNNMFDLATKRLAAAHTHTSEWVILMFVFIAIICSILSGFRMAKQDAFSWSYAVIFSVAITITMYVVLDFEYPRYGFIQLDKFEKAIVENQKHIIEKLSEQ